METAINVTLPEDFYILCSIYQIKPEVFIQQFINQVSFPSYFSNPTGSDCWATLCFLNFIDVQSPKFQVNEDLEIHYLNLFKKAIRYNLVTSPEDKVKVVNSGRKVIRHWLKAVLADRTKYITDSL
ncbi:hypothetical protein [Pedobacter sp. UYP1]|uniref:hypothetical protein n=1 Tax=Pedobacter sp. UYP1 TaxID=1756396 RepID=UPI0033977D1A